MASLAATKAAAAMHAVAGEDEAALGRLIEAVTGDMMLAMLGTLQSAAAACAEICLQRLAAQRRDVLDALEAKSHKASAESDAESEASVESFEQRARAVGFAKNHHKSCRSPQK